MNSILKELLKDLFGIDADDVVSTQNGGDKQPKRPKREKKEINPKLFSTIMVVGILLIVALAFFNSFYTVSEQQNAVVTRAGKVNSVKGAGLHFKMPFLDNVVYVDTKTQAMEIGYRTTSDPLDSSESLEEIDSESLMITSDFNFVVIDFFVEYKVISPEKFAFATTSPINILKNAVQAEIRSVVAKYSVDEVLTTAKAEIQNQIMESANQKAEDYNIGIYVEGVSIQDAEPPTTEVSNAFKAVESAKQNKETEINKANQYYNEELPQARSEADRTIKAAESVKESRIAEATGQTARFNEMFLEYIKYPEITKTRLYYETMEEVLPGMKVYLDDGSGLLKTLPLSQ
ncbi:MAG: FtsH protease activity modulator HflK [Lachnospirales bacterium]